MDENFFKNVITTVLIVSLLVLSFFLLKPILLSIISGIILAFIFSPVYDFINSKIKMPNISASIVLCVLLIMIILPLWFLTPIIIDQAFKSFQSAQGIDFVLVLKKISPSLFASEQFSSEIGSIIRTFVTKITNSMVNGFSDIILNFLTIALHLLVVGFTFFFVLRDKAVMYEYIKSLMPFSKDIERRFFESSKEITSSVIYGQIIIGVIQGLIAGLGFIVLGVPNALLLTLLACIMGVIPIVGTGFLWIPVAIFLLLQGDTFATFTMVFFGTVSSVIDNFLRPFIVSKKAKMHSALVLIGMIGGVFFFGLLGFVLGPLILAYLFIILELYRKKQVPGVFIQQPSE